MFFFNWFFWSKVKVVEVDVECWVYDIFEFLEFGYIVYECVGNFFGGQKKFLEFGCIMMIDVKLVFFDELVVGVNWILLQKFEVKIDFFNKECGYIFILIEYDMEMIEKFCDLVVCMVEGVVLIEGDFQMVCFDLQVLEVYFGEIIGDVV